MESLDPTAKGLEPAFFARPTLEVARDLIGCGLVTVGSDGIATGGRIVEVEAYLGTEDAASHAGRGPTPRSAIMFGPAGRAYVYLIYGMHHCLNLVTENDGTPGAILVRALEPETGLEIMRRRRGIRSGTGRVEDLCSGPGKLSRALGVDLGWNGLVLDREGSGIPVEPGYLRCLPAWKPPEKVRTTPRIGIRKAVDLPYRYVDPDSACLSR